MSLAPRINSIEESRSVQLAGLIAKLRKEGKEIIGLNVGEPDFPTPEPIVTATKKALDDNHTRYSLVAGIVELREAIAKKINQDHDLKIGPEHVFLGNGSKHILYNIFQTLLGEGDEVIVPLPYWVTFPESIKLAGGVPVYIDTDHNQLNLENVKKAISPKTKAIIINSPNNPTGAVYPEEVLRELMEIAKEHDFYVISDEAYEALLYDGIKHINLGTFSEDAFNRTITVQSFSKSYCMTGFRLGYMIANTEVMKGVNKLQSHLSGNNCTFAQYGALAALEMSDQIIGDMVKVMQKRRDLAFDICKDFLDVEKPQGAFYLYADVKKYLNNDIPTDEALAEYILREAGVALLPGSFFGTPGFLRICFAPSEEEIKKGLNKVKELLCK